MSTAGEAQPQAAAAAEAVDATSLLDQVVAATRPQSEGEAGRARDYFRQFVGNLVPVR